MTNPMIRELDYQLTPIGALVLRCRQSPQVGNDLVYEVKLDDEMLMSSSVNESERQLARLALDGRREARCDVLIGGLGLGYTAAAALEYPNVRRVEVVELLAPVIRWHHEQLVPAARQLLADSRCRFIQGDFFELVSAPVQAGAELYDVILVDIDHSPNSLLRPRHGDFYTRPRLARLAEHLRPGGTFALWSAEEPGADFLEPLAESFAAVQVHEVRFFNPHVREFDSNWIVLADRPRRS